MLVRSLVAVLCLFMVSGQNLHAAKRAQCTRALGMAGVDAKANWRKANTYLSSSGKLFPTNASRERNIKDRQVDDIDTITAQDSTPAIEFFPIPGVKETDQTPSGNVPNRVEVSGTAVKDGKLKGTLFLPVSGHLGKSYADKWKTTDTFNVYVVDSTGKRTDLAKSVKSLDYITIMEVAIPLEKGKMVSLYYERSGSGGVGGFREGRTLEFIWK